MKRMRSGGTRTWMRVALAVTLSSLVLIAVASATAAQPGEYRGTTEQGLFVQLTVNPSGEFVRPFFVGLDLPCARSNRVWQTGVFFFVNIPIRNDTFRYEVQTFSSRVSLSGRFTGESTVEGQISATFAALTPRGGLEKCALSDLKWSATLVETAVAPSTEGLDSVLEIREKHGMPTVTVAERE